MNKFKLEAPQFVFDFDFKRKLVYCLYIQHLFSKIDFNVGGENDLSASIMQTGFFSRGDVKGFNRFVIAICEITYDLEIAARTPAKSRKVERTPYLHLKFSNERNWPWVFRRSLIFNMPLLAHDL